MLAVVGFVALLFPRHVNSNATVNAGYGPLRLQGYAIEIPFFRRIELGRWTAFYQNGTLGKEQTFFFGVPRELREYYPEGVLKSEGHYRNGRVFGEWRSYHPTGKLAVVNVFDGQDEWPVAQKIFSEAGELIYQVDGGRVLVDREDEMKKSPNSAAPR